MTTQKHKQRRDARENRTQILNTVLSLSQQGSNISDMKMSDIAQLAGVGVGTLYRHFENKATLCIAMLDAQVEEMFEDIDKFLEAHSDASEYQRIEGILHIYVSLKEANFHTLAFIETSFNQSMTMVQIPFYNQLSERINAQFDEPWEDDFITHILLNCFTSEFYFYAKDKKHLSKEIYIQKVLDIILK